MYIQKTDNYTSFAWMLSGLSINLLRFKWDFFFSIMRLSKLKCIQEPYISICLYISPSVFHGLSFVPSFSFVDQLPFYSKTRPLLLAAMPSRCSLVQIFAHRKPRMYHHVNHHVSGPCCLSGSVILPHSLSAAAVSVPSGHGDWSVQPHDPRIWVNSGRSWVQRCRLGFAVSRCEESL